MSWFMIVLSVLSFLGPILAELLWDWLNRAAQEMPQIFIGEENPSPQEMADLWDRAIAKIPFYRWGAKAIARAAKKVCVARATELYISARTRTPPAAMTPDEAATIAREL